MPSRPVPPTGRDQPHEHRRTTWNADALAAIREQPDTLRLFTNATVRIDYLDDRGFWAFGRFDDDELHHAGSTLMHMVKRVPGQV